MNHRLLAASTLVSLAITTSPAAAAPQDDLAFEVGEYSSYVGALIVDKLLTFKLGAKCWEKVLDKKSFAIGSISGATRGLAAYAKEVTEDDWSRIAGQSVNSKERNREIVEGMVDAFKSRFHLTLVLEGADCDASGNAMWLKYLSTTRFALEKYPPKAAKVFITINVTAKAKGVKTEFSKDRTRITITAARDVEKSGWPDEIEKPFKRYSTKP